MKITAWGGLLAVAMTIAAVCVAQDSAAHVSAPNPTKQGEPGSETLIALPLSGGSQEQAVVVIDPSQKVMSVYHIDAATGKIALKSVRNISWDLRLERWNIDEPLPREIRSMIEQL